MKAVASSEAEEMDTVLCMIWAVPSTRPQWTPLVVGLGTDYDGNLNTPPKVLQCGKSDAGAVSARCLHTGSLLQVK
jgi:hypothetical protein